LGSGNGNKRDTNIHKCILILLLYSHIDKTSGGEKLNKTYF